MMASVERLPSTLWNQPEHVLHDSRLGEFLDFFEKSYLVKTSLTLESRPLRDFVVKAIEGFLKTSLEYKKGVDLFYGNVMRNRTIVGVRKTGEGHSSKYSFDKDHALVFAALLYAAFPDIKSGRSPRLGSIVERVQRALVDFDPSLVDFLQLPSGQQKPEQLSVSTVEIPGNNPVRVPSVTREQEAELRAWDTQQVSKRLGEFPQGPGFDTFSFQKVDIPAHILRIILFVAAVYQYLQRKKDDPAASFQFDSDPVLSDLTYDDVKHALETCIAFMEKMSNKGSVSPVAENDNGTACKTPSLYDAYKAAVDELLRIVNPG